MAARPSFRLLSVNFARHLARDPIAISIGVGDFFGHARRAVVSDIAADNDLTDTLAMAMPGRLWSEHLRFRPNSLLRA